MIGKGFHQAFKVEGIDRSYEGRNGWRERGCLQSKAFNSGTGGSRHGSTRGMALRAGEAKHHGRSWLNLKLLARYTLRRVVKAKTRRRCHCACYPALRPVIFSICRLASCRSAVAKPSLNRPYTSASRVLPCSRRPCLDISFAKLIAVRSSQLRSAWDLA